MLMHLRKSTSLYNSVYGIRHFSMKIYQNVQELREARGKLPTSVKVGFVPTMGGLHSGHLSLVQQAKKKTDVVIVSIFVNQKQFGPNEDFHSYPRALEKDIEILKDCGVDMVFAPSTEEMYSSHYRTSVEVAGFDDVAEGKCRPGFFKGVATVVTKLFNIVQPTHTFFGQKDAVQCVVIRRLIEDLNLPIELFIGETTREKDGLALSTRNQYMTVEERNAAPIVHRGLQALKEIYDNQKGPVSSQDLRNAAKNVYLQEKLIQEIQYISIGSKETMEELDVVDESKGAIASVAVKLGSVRLIDNIILE